MASLAAFHINATNVCKTIRNQSLSGDSVYVYVTSKRPAGTIRKPAAAKKPRGFPKVPKLLQRLRAFIVSLERRPDRSSRVTAMLKKHTPWLQFELFPASDGTKNPIPEEDVAAQWNTQRNAHFADYYEWVHDAPGSDKHGTFWMWAADTLDEDKKAGHTG